MLDQMSMPVLFVIVFVVLGLAAGGLFVAMRFVGARQRSQVAPTPAPSAQEGSIHARR
jgi:F0F1-type ATP synthase assembly protein I